MKKYLLGLGAMFVGVGLMFVLMHGEVSAEQKIKCELIDAGVGQHTTHYSYCKINDLTCVSAKNGLSCVRGSMF